jgi:methyltransferase family protein
VVEIGTHRGGTLWAWCQVAEPDTLIVSIDLDPPDHEKVQTSQLLELARARQALRLLRLDSHDEETFEALRAELRGRLIDFLFIDGDHSYDGVRLDYEMYGPLVARGGLIAFHDVLPHPHKPEVEVERFWREIRGDFRHIQLLDAYDRGWGGIGVLYAGIEESDRARVASPPLSRAAMRLLSVGRRKLPAVVRRLMRAAGLFLLSRAAAG